MVTALSSTTFNLPHKYNKISQEPMPLLLEVQTLLQKGSSKVVLLSDIRFEVCTMHFAILKKYGTFRPILEL